jgi:hypothetical protein
MSAKRVNKARKVLIAKYANAACFLYGLISVSEFVNVFNHYEDDKTNPEEVEVILETTAENDDAEYSLFNGLIYGPDFLPEFTDNLENSKIVREEQKGKPRYLPEKDEFLRYNTGNYREPEQPYADLKKYILDNRLCEKEGINGVDGHLMDIYEMIQNDYAVTECFQYFIDRKYPLDSLDKMNSFMQVIMNAYNNTRMYENNGFTPNEMSKKFERPSLSPLSKNQINLSLNKKAGRNELCPCGSGLKYKKCHGK